MHMGWDNIQKLDIPEEDKDRIQLVGTTNALY